MENFSFKCSKIVKNALFLKKARVPSRMNAKKEIAVNIYFLWSNQNAQKVQSTCLANTNNNYRMSHYLLHVHIDYGIITFGANVANVKFVLI